MIFTKIDKRTLGSAQSLALGAYSKLDGVISALSRIEENQGKILAAVQSRDDADAALVKLWQSVDERTTTISKQLPSKLFAELASINNVVVPISESLDVLKERLDGLRIKIKILKGLL